MFLALHRPGHVSGFIWGFGILFSQSTIKPSLKVSIDPQPYLLVTTMSWSIVSTELQTMILKEILLPSDLVMIPCAPCYQQAVLPAKSLNVLRISRGVYSLGLSIFHRNVFTLIETGDYDTLVDKSLLSGSEEECVGACELFVEEMVSLMT